MESSQKLNWSNFSNLSRNSDAKAPTDKSEIFQRTNNLRSRKSSRIMRSSSLKIMIFMSCFMLTLSGCLAMQAFSEEPQYTEVNPGGKTVLACKVENKGGECRWQKDGKPIGIFPGKYQWAGHISTGDCSLEILSVNITFDDGLWQCQVTSSSFQTQDALASETAKLVVRESPTSVTLSHNRDDIRDGAGVTVVAGQTETLICESRQSNPAPIMRWFLADAELKLSAEQRNYTEDDDPRRWRTTSELRHKFAKVDFGKTLKCRVEHPAYPTGFADLPTVLDVLYKPEVTIQTEADQVLEEARNGVSLTCKSDANPPGKVFWRKYGAGDSSDSRQYVESLEFKPVMRADSGTYICQAENSIGLSNEDAAEIDVLYPPKILRVTPVGGTTIGVHNTTILTCSAEGNPLPKYQWLQKLPNQQVLKRGYEDKLVLEDTTYDHQGDYVCEAINMIGGDRKIVQSEPIRIEVRGAPQVLRYTVAKEVEAVSGRDVRLEMEVCSDPIPSRTTWDWGALRVDAGQELHGRFLAEQMVEHPEREDCYIARLLLRNVEPSDSRRYYLDVENAHGTDRYAIALTVKDPVSMASVIGVVIALLVLFVITVLVLLYAYKKQKICFRDGSTGKYYNTNNVENRNIISIDSPNKQSPNSGSAVPVISSPLPPDGMYNIESGRAYNEESLYRQSGALADKLWPESHNYQVYIPGYHQHQSIVHASANNINPAPMRARSTTPTGGNNNGSFDSNPMSASTHRLSQGERNAPQRGGGLLYSDLQFPSTSNFGSMKKKSNKHKLSAANSTTVLTQQGDPSPSTTFEELSGNSASHHERNHRESRIEQQAGPNSLMKNQSQSLEDVLNSSYLPGYIRTGGSRIVQRAPV